VCCGCAWLVVTTSPSQAAQHVTKHWQTGRERPRGTRRGAPAGSIPGVAHVLSAVLSQHSSAAQNAARHHRTTAGTRRVTSSSRAGKRRFALRRFSTFETTATARPSWSKRGRDSPRVSSCVSSTTTRPYAVPTRGKRRRYPCGKTWHSNWPVPHSTALASTGDNVASSTGSPRSSHAR